MRLAEPSLGEAPLLQRLGHGVAEQRVLPCMTQTATQPAPPADQKIVWLDEEIWPEILAMMHRDSYFWRWMKANEVAATPYGPIRVS